MSLYDTIAQGMKVRGLRCETCGYARPITQGQAATMLRWGWPKCHGATMRLLTENDPGDGAPAPTDSTKAPSTTGNQK